ncbi:hypothetical protein CCR75_009152 [Bremia lactucae]|uniref:Uncharacterized protein n=1 Tax=Bremia lactucae TaxID=4779 RepID=A0A976FK30_BRELC|nr:hypothetical protein CCR75_009152 [Bremia lactucae]
MAKGAWISDETRRKIVQLRADGMAAKDIAELTGCSTNYIYRVLRKFNGIEPRKKKHKTVSLDVPSVSASQGKSAGERRDHLLEDLTDSSAALLCAVENMEVSAYEPLPMPRSVQGFKQVQTENHAFQDALSASVTFSTEACRVDKAITATPSDKICIISDTPSSAGCPVDSSTSPLMFSNTSTSHQDQSQLSLRGQSTLKLKPSASHAPSKTSTQPSSAPTSTSLVVNLNLPRANTKARNDIKDSLGGLSVLLKHIQDEIQRLRSLPRRDTYDAQVLEMLVKCHAEMLLVQLKRTTTAGKLNGQEMDASMDSMEMSRLHREKLAKEITLLSIQAVREQLELERELIRHTATSTSSSKNHTNTIASPIDANEPLSRQ